MCVPGASLCIDISNNAAGNFTFLSLDDPRAKYCEYSVREKSRAVKGRISRPSGLSNTCGGALQMGGLQPALENYRSIKQQRTL